MKTRIIGFHRDGIYENIRKDNYFMLSELDSKRAKLADGKVTLSFRCGRGWIRVTGSVKKLTQGYGTTSRDEYWFKPDNHSEFLQIIKR